MRWLGRTSGPVSHGDLCFAVGAQVPGAAARAAVKAGGLRAKGLGQLLRAELAPGRVAGPPGCGGGLSRQVAAGGGPGLAASDPGLVVARRGKAGGGRVARRGPGAGVEQRGQVLAGSRGPRREGQRGRFGRGKTLVEVLWGGFCGDSGGEPGSEVRPRGRGPSDSGDGAGRGQAAGRGGASALGGTGRGQASGAGLRRLGGGQAWDLTLETRVSTPRALAAAVGHQPGGPVRGREAETREPIGRVGVIQKLAGALTRKAGNCGTGTGTPSLVI